MSDAYERVKGGRLTFKGGVLGTRAKSIDKKKKKKKNIINESSLPEVDGEEIVAFPSDDPTELVPASNSGAQPAAGGGGGEIYTIDAAKKMKYEDLFPVEAKRFGYDPKAKLKSVDEALEDRVKKKADRYCK